MAIPRHIMELLEGLEISIKEALLKSINDVKSSAQLSLIVSALERGDVTAALQALQLGPEFFSPLDDALRAAYLAGGAAALAEVSNPLRKASTLVVRFNGRNPRAEAWTKERSSNLIVEITGEARELIRSRIVAGLIDGQHPTEIARSLVGRINRQTGLREGGVIGLNSRLADFVESARVELKSGDSSLLQNYLSRGLRNNTFDSAVLKSIETGRPLSKATIEKMVNSYANRLLDYRGTMIARTEATAAYNAARHEGYEQMVQSGAVREEFIKRRWRSAGADGRTRDSHMALHNSEVSGLSEPFVSPLSGARMLHPGDTSLGAPGEEVINCRCYGEYSIDFIGVARNNGR